MSIVRCLILEKELALQAGEGLMRTQEQLRSSSRRTGGRSLRSLVVGVEGAGAKMLMLIGYKSCKESRLSRMRVWSGKVANACDQG